MASQLPQLYTNKNETGYDASADKLQLDVYKGMNTRTSCEKYLKCWSWDGHQFCPLWPVICTTSVGLQRVIHPMAANLTGFERVALVTRREPLPPTSPSVSASSMSA